MNAPAVRTGAIRFEVLHVNCRHCGDPIEIESHKLQGLSADAQLAECEKQAAEKHACPKAPKESP